MKRTYRKYSNNLIKITNIYPQEILHDINEEFDSKYNNWSFEKLESDGSYSFGELLMCSNDNQYSYNNDLGWIHKFFEASIYAKHALKKYFRNPTKDYELQRIQTNIQYYGMEAGWHVDERNEDGIYWSMVTYVNLGWDYTWDGNFCFADSDGEHYAIPPTPNSGVLFDATCDHKGSAPNRFYDRPRKSLAYLFKEVDNNRKGRL